MTDPNETPGDEFHEDRFMRAEDGFTSAGRPGRAYLLTCPRCGSEHTHLDRVGLQVRSAGEDSDFELVGVGVDGRLGAAPEGMTTSSRRSAIALHGTCEQGCVFTITFAQHKGRTDVQPWHGEDPDAEVLS